MNNQELYKLFKNSKLAQVATPLSTKLRGSNSPAPTHQIIYTPKSSAIRANFGIKTALPKQIGYSHIVYNDIDNFKNLPDVEKYAGPHYNRLKFQETGMVVKKAYNKGNPLFAWDTSKTVNAASRSGIDSVLAEFQLGNNASIEDVRQVLKRNPTLHAEFKRWLVKKSPESIMLKVPSKIELLLKEFVASSETIQRQELKIQDLIRKRGKETSHAPSSKIQGTGGFSYNQKGRLTNTPNGIKHGVIAPGRLVDDREAAIGGFVTAVNERTTLLQANYAKNAPGKHSRQFILPFKMNEAEITPNGGVRMHADGVKIGSWMLKTERGHSYDNRTGYVASNPKFGHASQRNLKDSSALESLLGLVSKSRD